MPGIMGSEDRGIFFCGCFRVDEGWCDCFDRRSGGTDKDVVCLWITEDCCRVVDESVGRYVACAESEG